MTLFTLWVDRLQEMNVSKDDDAGLVNQLQIVLSTLKDDFGTWRVTWGEVSRLQRYDESSGGSFRDDLPSVPAPGVNGRDGGVFTIAAVPVKGQKRRYGVAGGTYVSIVEFGPKVRAESVHVFGSSGDPKSRHFMDQSPMYARGEFKPAWIALEDIKANLERSYRPGEEK